VRATVQSSQHRLLQDHATGFVADRLHLDGDIFFVGHVERPEDLVEVAAADHPCHSIPRAQHVVLSQQRRRVSVCRFAPRLLRLLSCCANTAAWTMLSFAVHSPRL
jgi:hypothetical protein